jgi:hypothetical protein
MPVVDKFDFTSRDSQATRVEPVPPDRFDYDAYAGYEQHALEFCRSFWAGKSGVAVYRRMRVAEVFSDGCADMRRSLEWQLGGLQKSLEYRMDVPNFLEPWYGIGTAAGAFGPGYTWNRGQAPAIVPPFSDTGSALDHPDVVPVRETEIGRHTLEMIGYFMEETSGRLPLSLCDVQSPLNTAGILIDINNFLVDTMISPEKVRVLLEVMAGLISDFASDQLKLIGESVVWPGHGFASSRAFSGFGASDDNILMVTPGTYRELAIPAMVRMCQKPGGAAFHSCGNWTGLAETVRLIPGLTMVDGAFTSRTDPDPNPPEPIRDVFAGTGITVCARMVGSPDTVMTTVRRLWHPRLKLIVVTYCQTPDEQDRLYDSIHHHCV